MVIRGQKVRGTKFFVPRCMRNEYNYIRKFEVSNGTTTYVEVQNQPDTSVNSYIVMPYLLD